MITISHSHENGTLAHGTDKGDGTAPLLKASGFRWMPSIRVWGISGSRDHLARRHQIDRAAAALRAAGFDVMVEIDDAPRDVAIVKADRAERLDDRYGALAASANRHAAASQAAYDRADEIAKSRPLGQPILVGHHSEARARADQRRIERAMDTFVDEHAKARHYVRAAAVVGEADAYRELPEVIVRRIAKTEADLRRTERAIAGQAYGEVPAGGWLAGLQARKAYLEHQLAADREALTHAQAAGYKLLTAADVHKGDIVYTGSGALARGYTVVRVSARSVSVETGYTWTDRLGYDRIRRVECPHAAPAAV